jgi:predicted N-acyltransferase
MPDGSEQATVRVVEHIRDIPAEAWDACTGGNNPFLSHAFLNALELSGCVRAETGWLPQHLVVEDEAGNVAACAPLYLKSHSQGEYVFDWGWADAFERAGGDYYPKLQSAVPFTPATGPRLLVRPDVSERYYDVLIAGMVEVTRRYNVSSLHVTFPPKDQWERFGQAGFLQRTAKQFHWQNRGYETFDDFLAALSSRKRKAIRKERREVAEQGVSLQALTGSEITEAHWDAFFDFYMDTAGRKWGQPYLNREFFSRLGESLAGMVVLIMAEEAGDLVAGALNLRGADTLYGRNWGCLKDFKFLHFEACYYQAIDYAIAHKLEWVEAGAQGPHKVQRGYLPRTTYSAHWIENPSFRDAVEGFLRQERRSVDAEIAHMMEYSPYRREDND